MRARRGSSEWSLVAFTVLTQAAAGICIVRAAFAPTAPVMPLALGALVLGTLAATLHLGRPAAARLTLANLRASWLSREAALGTAFGAAVIVEMLAPGPVARIGVAVLGAVLVASIARIYMLRTVPAWNSWTTPAAFFGTALGLGAASTAAALAIDGRDPGSLGSLAAFVVATSLLIALLHLRRLAGRGGAGAESAAIVHEERPVALGLRIATGFSAAALLLVCAFPGREAIAPGVAAAAAVLLVSEATGRSLFYASHRRVGM